MKVDIHAIDANVIVRSLMLDDQILSPKARSTMEAVQDGLIEVYCEPVILGEVVFVLSSFYQLPREKIAEGLRPILSAPGFRMPHKQRYVRALELYARSVPHFGDACMCVAALDECNGHLLSFDRKLSRIDGIDRAESPK